MHIGTKASNLEKPTKRIRKHRFLKWFKKKNVVRSNLTSTPRFPVLCILANGDIASYIGHYFSIYRASQVVLVVENLPADAGNKRCRFSPWVGKIPWRRKRQPTPVLMPGEPHGQGSLAGYGP